MGGTVRRRSWNATSPQPGARDSPTPACRASAPCVAVPWSPVPRGRRPRFEKPSVEARGAGSLLVDAGEGPVQDPESEAVAQPGAAVLVGEHALLPHGLGLRDRRDPGDGEDPFVLPVGMNVGRDQVGDLREAGVREPLRRTGDGAHADVSELGDAGPDPGTLWYRAQRPAVPVPATGGDEPVLAGVLPGPFSVIAEGDVPVLAVPLLLLPGDAARLRAGFLLLVAQPRSRDVLAVAVAEVAEEDGVDGHAVGPGEVGDDALRLGVEVAGDDSQEVAGVELLGQGDLEGLLERDLERDVERPVGGVLRVDGEHVLVGQVLDPGAVVQGLRHHVARCLVPLELEDVDGTVTVECEQVNVLAVDGGDLAADQQQRLPKNRRVGLYEVLEALLAGHPHGQQALDSVIQTPEPDVDRHVVPIRSESASQYGHRAPGTSPPARARPPSPPYGVVTGGWAGPGPGGASGDPGTVPSSGRTSTGSWMITTVVSGGWVGAGSRGPRICSSAKRTATHAASVAESCGAYLVHSESAAT